VKDADTVPYLRTLVVPWYRLIYHRLELYLRRRVSTVFTHLLLSSVFEVAVMTFTFTANKSPTDLKNFY